MLVISRMKNEGLTIADGLIRIVVVDIRGDKVRIGVEAPRDIPVHRDEVQAAIEHANQVASPTENNRAVVSPPSPVRSRIQGVIDHIKRQGQACQMAEIVELLQSILVKP